MSTTPTDPEILTDTERRTIERVRRTKEVPRILDAVFEEADPAHPMPGWASDDRLSFRARGLLAAALAAHNPITLSALRQRGSEGKDAVSAALDELLRNGYASREVRRDRGRISSVAYRFRHTPQEERAR